MQKDIVVITGGTSGLGLELVKKFIDKGYYVCNLSRNKDKLELLDKQYLNHQGFVGNIVDEEFVKRSVNEIGGLGNIKILINNAASAVFKSPTEYVKSDVDKSLESLEGMILCTTEILNIKKESDLKIVNIMSSAALKGKKEEAVYCATKWGQRGYTESLKVAYKRTSVKVIGVYPGGMNTNFWNDNRNYVSQEKQNTFMNPKDVAEIIVNNVLCKENLVVSDILIERN